MSRPDAPSARSGPRLRVLMVNDLPPGPGSGTEVFVARLADGLTRSGHHVEVIHPRAPHRGLTRWRDGWDPEMRRQVRTAARGCDVVHVHNFVRECSSSVLDAAPDVPLVCSVHDHRLLVTDRPGRRWSPATVASGGLGRIARSRVRRTASAVTAATPELAARLVAAGIGPVTVVAPFADPDPGPWSPSTGRDVVYAGRLTRTKGVDVLIDAFAAAARSVPGTQLRLAGDGPDAEWLRTHARAVAGGTVADRIRFEGLLDREEVDALLHDARVVCVPSVAPEGLPLLLVEAMVVGRAVVASDQPSMRGALRDGELGLLVAPGDAGALAATLTDLLADDTRVASLGRAARLAGAATYATAAAVARVEQVYREVLATRG